MTCGYYNSAQYGSFTPILRSAAGISAILPYAVTSLTVTEQQSGMQKYALVSWKNGTLTTGTRVYTATNGSPAILNQTVGGGNSAAIAVSPGDVVTVWAVGGNGNQWDGLNAAPNLTLNVTFGISTGPINGPVTPYTITASATLTPVLDANGNVAIQQNVYAGTVSFPDGTIVNIPASGPTLFSSWAGDNPVAQSTNYNGNVVWDYSVSKLVTQQYKGMATSASISDAYKGILLAITYGVNMTTGTSSTSGTGTGTGTGGGTGGGGTGSPGSGGGGRSCFSGDVQIETMDGLKSFAQIECEGGKTTIKGVFGPKIATLIVHEAEEREMLFMPDSGMVTPDHAFFVSGIRNCVRADELFDGPIVMYRGKVYNLSIDGEQPLSRRFYKLSTGHLASNVKIDQN